MFDTTSITSAAAPRSLSPETEVDVAFLRDPGDRMAPSADLLRSPAFFRWRAGAFSRAWYAVVMDDSTAEAIAGGWYAEVAPGEVHSGAGAEFGNIHSPYAPLPLALASRIVRAAEEELRARAVRRVRVTLPPEAYEPDAHAIWMNVYLRDGYIADAPELSLHLDVDAAPLADRMHVVQAAVVRTAERRGISARALRADERADAYTILDAADARHGRSTPHTLDALLALDDALPGIMHWHGAFQHDQLLAASVSVALADDQCAILAVGDVGDGTRVQPTTVLVAELHAWCASQGVRRLHLGLASNRGVPDEARIAVFQQLGATLSAQCSLEKALDA